MTKNVCVLAWVLFFSMISVVLSEEQTEHVEKTQYEASQEDEGERPNGEKAEQASKTKKEKIRELAIEVQNPVSDLIQFGFTNIMPFGAGPNNSHINIFNLNASTTRKFGQWAILNRLVVPLVYLPASVPDAPSGDSGKSFGLAQMPELR